MRSKLLTKTTLVLAMLQILLFGLHAPQLAAQTPDFSQAHEQAIKLLSELIRINRWACRRIRRDRREGFEQHW